MTGTIPLNRSGNGALKAAQIFCIALFACLFAYHPIWDLLFRGGSFGWDLRVACAAHDDLLRGMDPYLVSNTGGALSFPYPVFAGYLSGLFCIGLSTFPHLYWFIDTVVVTVCGGLIAITLFQGALFRILVVLTFLTGFNAFYALVQTGNLAIFELPLATVTVIAHERGRMRSAGIALGAMASFKLIPIVYSLAFLMPRIRVARRIEALLSALAAFAALEILSAALRPALLSSFAAELIGRIPGQQSPYGENFLLINDENFIDFITLMMKGAGLDKFGLIAGALALLFFAIGVSASWLANSPVEVRNNGVSVFGVTVLLLSLCLFRLKPYAYMTLIPFALASLVNAGRWQQLCGLMTIGTGFVVWALTGFQFATEYHQLLGLVSCLVVVIAVQSWNRVAPDTSAQSIMSQDERALGRLT